MRKQGYQQSQTVSQSTETVNQLDHLLTKNLITTKNCFEIDSSILGVTEIDVRKSKDWTKASKYISSNSKIYSLRAKNCEQNALNLIVSLEKLNEDREEDSSPEMVEDERLEVDQSKGEIIKRERFRAGKKLCASSHLDMSLKEKKPILQHRSRVDTFNRFQSCRGNRFLSFFQIQEDFSLQATFIQEPLPSYNLNFDCDLHKGPELIGSGMNKYFQEYEECSEKVKAFSKSVIPVKENGGQDDGMMMWDTSKQDNNFDWTYPQDAVNEIVFDEDIPNFLKTPKVTKQEKGDGFEDGPTMIKKEEKGITIQKTVNVKRQKKRGADIKIDFRQKIEGWEKLFKGKQIQEKRINRAANKVVLAGQDLFDDYERLKGFKSIYEEMDQHVFNKEGIVSTTSSQQGWEGQLTQQTQRYEVKYSDQGAIIYPQLPQIPKPEQFHRFGTSQSNFDNILPRPMRNSQNKEIFDRLQTLVTDSSISLISALKMNYTRSDSFIQDRIVQLIHFCNKKGLTIDTKQIQSASQ